MSYYGNSDSAAKGTLTMGSFVAFKHPQTLPAWLSTILHSSLKFELVIDTMLPSQCFKYKRCPAD